MSEPFLAEVRIVGFNFAPRSWAQCDGQILPINQNQSLYSLLGTTYGGDGRTTFALPDMRGRTPIHVDTSGGANHYQGQKSGEDAHTLSANEMPQHTHALRATTGGANTNQPAGNVLAKTAATDPFYLSLTSPVDMSTAAVLAAGGGAAHENSQPSIALNFCIALQGLFPSRN
jgi:microcystin-dependent protein